MYANETMSRREYARASSAHMVSWLTFGTILVTATIGSLAGLSMLLG